MYGNEDLVGEALAPWIERHGRNSVFVTSKVWNDAHQPAAARRVFVPWQAPVVLQLVGFRAV